jgi:uncharacterized membrane protein HdeD (DUF308 family)
MDVTSKIVPRGESVERDQTDLWWVFLIGGVLWLLFALLVFQFDSRSVHAISLLLGFNCFGGAALELLAVPVSHGWWRVGRIALAVGFAIVGTLCFIDPGNSFKALSTIFAFYLLLRGLFEVVGAFFIRGVDPTWWLMLVLGAVQIGLAFWAAGNFGHKAFLLVVWVGATALAHGLVEIVRAFTLRPR